MAGDGGRPSIPSLHGGGVGARRPGDRQALALPRARSSRSTAAARSVARSLNRERGQPREQALRDHPDGGRPVVERGVEELFVAG